MASGIDRLVRVLPPPHSTQYDFEREQVERQLRTPLPDDYFEFLRRYGDGTIDSFMGVLMPLAKNRNIDLASQCERLAGVLKTVRHQTPDVRYAGYPAPGGLIPWAKTDNGDVCFWKTGDPDPNRWPVVLCDGKMWDWEEYPVTMTELLAELLVGKLQSKIFPEDFPSSSPTFLPE